ncbi:hypothetical protein AUJ84_01615 [Candidatus Pacearchaeota archaeon CG1_02_32_132]|nr:MAG: hypothetical protein AUJ84_01615 [Candidatus Pacearchaeota archaeon CG1_02_32_132]
MRKALSSILASSLLIGACSGSKPYDNQTIKSIETPENLPVFIAQYPKLGRVELIVSERADDYNENDKFDYPQEFQGIQRKFEYGKPVTITFGIENPSEDLRYVLSSPKADFKADNFSKNNQDQISNKHYHLEVGTYIVEAYHGNEKILGDWFEITPRWLNAEK